MNDVYDGETSGWTTARLGELGWFKNGISKGAEALVTELRSST